MNETQILFPILAHIALVIYLYVLLGLRKKAAVKNKAVDLKKTALDNKAWPPDVVQVSNNLANQFESPILFYALCLVIHTAGISNIAAVAMAWLFVMARFVHAYFHVGKNFVPYRFRAFLLSIFIIIALLIQTIVQILMKVPSP